MKQGTLDVMLGGMPAAIDVFDDGLVFVPGAKNAQVGMAFGALGAVIARTAAKRGLAKKREQLDALRPTSAAGAGAVEGCEVMTPADVRSIQIKKGLIGSGRRLTIDRAVGRKLTLGYSTKKQATSDVERLLRPLVGERLQLGQGA